MFFKKAFICIISFLLLNQIAFARSYKDPFYRKMTSEEISLITKQDEIKKFSCTEYLLKKEIKSLKGTSIIPAEHSFSKQPLFPNGNVACSVGIYNLDKKELHLNVNESGVIDGIVYSISHTGSDAIGHISKGLPSWSIVCDTYSPKNNSNLLLKRCYIEGGPFVIQRISENKALNLPEGYLISLGKNIFKPILQLNVGNKSYKPKSDYPFIFGQDANNVIEEMKTASTVTYSYMTPLLDKEKSDEIDPSYLEIIQVAINVLDRAYQLYTE